MPDWSWIGKCFMGILTNWLFMVHGKPIFTFGSRYRVYDKVCQQWCTQMLTSHFSLSAFMLNIELWKFTNFYYDVYIHIYDFVCCIFPGLVGYWVPVTDLKILYLINYYCNHKSHCDKLPRHIYNSGNNLFCCDKNAISLVCYWYVKRQWSYIIAPSMNSACFAYHVTLLNAWVCHVDWFIISVVPFTKND